MAMPTFDPVGLSRWIVADQRIGQWVCDRIGHLREASGFGPYTSLGVYDGTSIIAGVVFHDYNPDYSNVQISMAADTPRWATRSTIAKLMAYPFRQLGVNRVTTITPASFARVIKFNVGLGFQMEGVLRKGYGFDDAVIMGLLKDEAPAWMLA